MARVGSRIRTVAPAFPSQGPAYLAGMLAGTTVQLRRFGRNPVIRGRPVAPELDVPQRELVLGAPWPDPPDVAAIRRGPDAGGASSSADDCTDCE